MRNTRTRVERAWSSRVQNNDNASFLPCCISQRSVDRAWPLIGGRNFRRTVSVAQQRIDGQLVSPYETRIHPLCSESSETRRATRWDYNVRFWSDDDVVKAAPFNRSMRGTIRVATILHVQSRLLPCAAKNTILGYGSRVIVYFG